MTETGLYVSKDHPDAVRKVFDSEKEWRRFLFLVEEARAGRIHSLRRQRRFWLHGPNGAKLTRYIADFVYVRNGLMVVEDVKSEMTKRLASYKLRKAWMKDEYGVDITEA